MIRPGIDRVSREARIVRAWLARRAIKRKPELTWWLIYGPPRSGTTHILRMVKACSTLYVSDWGLAPILDPVPDWLKIRSSSDFDYIRFDYGRFLENISNNILDNAYLAVCRRKLPIQAKP